MKFLRLLVQHEMTAAQIGYQVWGNPASNPQAYVRPASRVLYRLRDEGWVSCRVTQDSRLTLWQATRMAVKYLDQILGGAVVSDDPQCTVCGRPRSQGCENPTACEIAALPFSQECDATRDCNDYVCVQDVRRLIPPERWPELERLYMLEVGDCDQCGGKGKYQRSNTRCVSCGGSGKQIIAGGVR